jgi:hypothetical protein
MAHADAVSDSARRRLAKIFRTSSRLQRELWDMAYALTQWPDLLDDWPGGVPCAAHGRHLWPGALPRVDTALSVLAVLEAVLAAGDVVMGEPPSAAPGGDRPGLGHGPARRRGRPGSGWRAADDPVPGEQVGLAIPCGAIDDSKRSASCEMALQDSMGTGFGSTI